MDGPLESVLDRGPAHVLGRHADGLAYAFMASAEGAQAFGHKHLYALRGLLNVTTNPVDLGSNYIGCSFSDVLCRPLLIGQRQPVSSVASLGLTLFELCRPLHERELFHGSISTDRIVISADTNLIISDCGVISAAKMNTPADLTIGTAGLNRVFRPAGPLPPELIQGESLSPRTDVFLIAVIVYELLMARDAFEAGSTLGRYQRISRGNHVPIDEGLGEIGLWTQRCLHPNPLERPTPDESIALLQKLTKSKEYSSLFSTESVLLSETLSTSRNPDYSKPFLASDLVDTKALNLWEAQLIARRSRIESKKPRRQWASWVAIVFLAILTWIFIDMSTAEMRSRSYDGRPGPAPQKNTGSNERYESKHKKGERRRPDRGQRIPRRSISL